MSGSKLFRLFSLFLCLLLCLANFSVVASAANDEENLISSDMSSWQYQDVYGDWNTPTITYNSSTNGNLISFGAESISQGDIFAIYDLSSERLKSGDSYHFTLSLDTNLWGSNTDFFKLNGLIIGFATVDNDGYIEFKENCAIDISSDNFSSFSVSNNLLTVDYDFVCPSYVGTPCFCILIYRTADFPNHINLLYYFSNLSLTRNLSPELDGILGWLQDIKNSITGLPETIKTNLSIFFNDLSTKLTELKNNIKTNLETLGSNINGKLGDVSTDFSSYVSGLGDRVSSFFSDLKTNLTSEFTAFKNKVNTEFTNLKSNLTTNFDNLRSTLSSRFDKVDNFLTEIRDFFHNLYWDLVGGTCGAGDVHSSLFERLGDRIRGFFEDLKVKIDIKVEEIKTAIHDFFVPPEGFFEEWKANFDLMLSENLGFIYETPDLIISFVSFAKVILDTDTEPSIIFPEISFELPGEYGVEIDLFEETEVDLSFLSESDVFSFLYFEAYPALLHVIFILALIGYAKYIWGRTMSN